jgi:GT2 family glycosyltransferase
MLRLNPKTRANNPRVSIVLAADGGLERLADCLVSLFGETTYSALEVLCIADNASSKVAARLVREFPIKWLSDPCNSNISCANNLGAQRASGRFIVFLGEDVRVLSPEWVEQMLYYAEQDDVGCVGGLLIRTDETVKHAGIMITTSAEHSGCRWRFAVGEPDGYWGSAICAHEVTGVSGCCAMFRRDLFVEVGEFDPAMASQCRDLDLCLRLRSRRKRIIFTPTAAFLDASSRADKETSADETLLVERWGDVVRAADPYYKRKRGVS